ncbi:heavy-metal-associated domain-containing protein [Aequorivita capsosiphonis]|uniref:heavy-metal-associated domain-containing protein n=1 Tax=Aequorivita capsosiphonis TaxID=487317 RepID=UPI00047C47E2|nr:heavy-metal-associated domain-containing protein [Aequorivita capsosiphonis]
MKTIFIIHNLKCRGCANTITNNLSSIQNISEVKVDVSESAVSFQSLTPNNSLKVKEKLKSLGYPCIEDSNSLTSQAKSFVSCATGKLSK